MTDEGADRRTGLSIQAVSEELTVPVATLRSWERRYGLTGTLRTAGGHRRYSEQDVADLRRMHQAIGRGARPGHAAALVRDTVRAPEPYRSFIEVFLQITAAAEPHRLKDLLDTCQARHGTDETVCKVLLPALRQVGLEWQSGRCDIAQEHLVTRAARHWLATTSALVSAPWQRDSVVLSCGPNDLHTVGLEAMELLLTQRGWRCYLLGERTQPPVLAAAIARTGAAAAIVVSHLPANRRTTVTALHAAQRTGAQIFYAGNAFLTLESRRSCPGLHLGGDLVEAAETVSTSLQGST